MSRCSDYQHWLGESEWLLDDAVLLVLGIDPNCYPRPRVGPNRVGQLLRMKRTPPGVFWGLLHAAMKAEGHDLAVLEYTSEIDMSRKRCALVEPAAFVIWAKQAGYIIPNELDHLLSEQESPPATRKIDQRVEFIRRVVRDLNCEPLEIPTGGKQKVRDACLEDSKLFSTSTFDKAWQEAVKRKVVRMEQHDKFSNA